MFMLDTLRVNSDSGENQKNLWNHQLENQLKHFGISANWMLGQS